MCTVSASQTVYLIPGNWDDDSPIYAAWVCEGGAGQSNKWVRFTNSGLGFWSATFEDGYTKIVLGRFSSTTTEFSWNSEDGFWNQSTDITYDSSNPVYTFNSWSDGKGVFNQTALYKLYVKNMDSDANVNFDSWNRGNSYFTWPGQTLTTETVGDVEWNVFYWPLSTINGVFTLDDSEEDHHTSGGQTFDLSTVKYYYYYPTLHEHVLTTEALAEPATIHFRTNAEDFDPAKYYFWNNEGINGSYCFSNETVNGYSWKTITTHKPTFSIQFYAGDGGDSDGTKTDNAAVTCISGENAFYVYRLSWGNNTKLDSKYYLISSESVGYDGVAETYLAQIEMEHVGGYIYKATLDNATATSDKHYLMIAPISALNEDKSIASTGWGSLIFSTNWDWDGPTKNPWTFTTFTEQSSLPTYQGKGWNRWHIYLPFKYEIYYNFITATIDVKPYFEREIDGYATFSSDYAVAIPDGVTAYYATAAETGKVTMTSISNGIPANTGAFLKADNDTYKFTPATATSSESTNLLVPGTASGVAASTTGKYHYVYAEQDGVSSFYNVGSNIAQDMTGKAYLETEESIKPITGARIAIVFDDDVTGINSVNRETINNNEYYNLAGQRVAQPAKGLYIVNGKKVIKH